MKLKKLLKQLNKLAKERPEALEMEVSIQHNKILKTLELMEIKIFTPQEFKFLKESIIIQAE